MSPPSAKHLRRQHCCLWSVDSCINFFNFAYHPRVASDGGLRSISLSLSLTDADAVHASIWRCGWAEVLFQLWYASRHQAIPIVITFRASRSTEFGIGFASRAGKALLLARHSKITQNWFIVNIIDRQQKQQQQQQEKQQLRMDMTQLSNFVMGVNYTGETMSRERESERERSPLHSIPGAAT